MFITAPTWSINNTAARTRGGRLWLPDAKGIYHYSWQSLTRSPLGQSLQITVAQLHAIIAWASGERGAGPRRADNHRERISCRASSLSGVWPRGDTASFYNYTLREKHRAGRAGNDFDSDLIVIKKVSVLPFPPLFFLDWEIDDGLRFSTEPHIRSSRIQAFLTIWH